ncbi:unnamed protein product [Peniophora sp. CBMAI 1063]|nr:unnamed protein product [Peniophora sp. CBMAI 1063]
MDGLDDLGLTGFDDPSSSPEAFGSPDPLSSDLPQSFPPAYSPSTSRTPVASPSRDRYAGSALPPLPLYEETSDTHHLAISDLTSAPSTSSQPVAYSWSGHQLRPQRSTDFNPLAHGLFPVPSVHPPTPSTRPTYPTALEASTPRNGLSGPLSDEPTSGTLHPIVVDDPHSRHASLLPQGELPPLDVLPLEHLHAGPSLSNLPAPQPQSAPTTTSRKRIVHSPFYLAENDTMWMEEVDAEEVQAFLASPRPTSDVDQLPPQGGAVSTTTRSMVIPPQALWRILSFKALLRQLLRRLPSLTAWKNFWLRLFFRSSARKSSSASSRKIPANGSVDGAFPRPGDPDWEAYGACMLYYIPRLRQEYVLPVPDAPPPIYPTPWPVVNVVPIVHQLATNQVLCPPLRHLPRGVSKLRWDVRGADFGIPLANAAFMSQPATWPLCSKLVISCCADDPQPQWPWSITVYSPWGVTLHEVLVAIKENMKQAIWPHEWDTLHPERRAAIERLHLARTTAHPLGRPLPEPNDEEVLRSDYLLGHTFFRGLTPNPDGDGWMMHFGGP